MYVVYFVFDHVLSVFITVSSRARQLTGNLTVKFQLMRETWEVEHTQNHQNTHWMKFQATTMSLFNYSLLLHFVDCNHIRKCIA